MKILFLLVLLPLIGCGEQYASNTGNGYVRNVWSIDGCHYVTFEREDGLLFTYSFHDVPPVWTGIHARINYSYNGGYNRCQYAVQNVQRIADPPTGWIEGRFIDSMPSDGGGVHQ